MSFGGSGRASGRSDKSWKDDHVLLVHFSGKSFLGYFLVRVSFSGDNSRLRFVSVVEGSPMEVSVYQAAA